MSLTIRRVVTGHDKNGRAIVSIDESVKNAAQTRRTHFVLDSRFRGNERNPILWRRSQ